MAGRKATLADVCAGSILRVFFNEDNPNNGPRHIVAIVDACQVVSKRWSKRVGWMYRVDDIHYWTYLIYNMDCDVRIVPRKIDAALKG